MADEEFLKEPEASEEKVEPEQEPEKVKLGDTEYTQVELDNLIKLGKIAQEAEEKYDRPISKYWPEYTKSQQKLKELEEKLQSLEQPKVPEAGSQEEVKTQALKQAKELGLVTVEDINNYIDSRIGAVKLEEDINRLTETTKEEGKPVPDQDNLLNYMADNGIKNPETAYKLMYEEELDQWKEKKLKTIKPEGLKTQSISTAGETKVPESKVPSNLEDLRSQLRSYMKRAEGSENA